MPVDNNTPRGNHFASSSPRPSGVPSNPGSAHGAPAPDTTKEFMMAHNRGHATPRAAQPVAATPPRVAPSPHGARRQPPLRARMRKRSTPPEMEARARP